MKFLLWTAMGITTAVMLLGGIAKLSGNELALQSFRDLGLPMWFALFIGCCEIAGAVGIWIRRTSTLAALGISCIMFGALFYHFSYPPLPLGIPALVVLLCALFIASRPDSGVFGKA